MDQVLLRIPLAGPLVLGPVRVPVFGFGLLFWLWVVVAAVWLFRHGRREKPNRSWLSPAALWLAVAAGVVVVPSWAVRSLDRRIATLSERLQRRPGAAELLLARAELFAQERQFARAVADYRLAVQTASDRPEPHWRLAWLLATCPDPAVRDGQTAVSEARLACRLSEFRSAAALDALAAAYAETGRFDRAVVAARHAARLALVERSAAVSLSEVRQRLGWYLKGRPWRSQYGPSVPVFGYGFMLFCAFLASGSLASWRARREGLGGELVWDLAVWLFVCGIIGARIFYVVQKHQLVYGGAEAWWDYVVETVNLREGGLVFYGSVVGGLVGFLVFCRRRGLHPLRLSDLVVPSIFVGLALGRVGCFLNGCCFGDVCWLPWAVRFPLGSIPDMALVQRGWLLPDSTFTLPLHPTQLYSVVNALVLAALASAWFSRRRRYGEVSALALLSYPVTRFLLEIVRGDELGQFGTRLTISQWVSLLTFGVGVFLALWVARAGQRVERPEAGRVG